MLNHFPPRSHLLAEEGRGRGGTEGKDEGEEREEELEMQVEEFLARVRHFQRGVGRGWSLPKTPPLRVHFRPSEVEKKLRRNRGSRLPHRMGGLVVGKRACVLPLKRATSWDNVWERQKYWLSEDSRKRSRNPGIY